MALGDWISKGAKRVQELGAEYKQHHTLLERLLALETAIARDELTRAWIGMDDRARASFKMTLAGLLLGQQATPSSAEAQTRGARLKALNALLDTLSTAAPTASGTPSTEAALTSGAARMATKLAGAAERARPRAAEMIERAHKGIEQHAPAFEAVIKNAINEILKVEVPGTAKPAAGAPPPPPPNEADLKVADDVEADASAASPGPSAGSTSIAGHWVGTLKQTGTTDTLGCDLHVSPNGRPLWSYYDTDGFKQMELTQVDQRLQYVPPERGVVTVTVQSVTGSATETGYVVDYSFERANNGYMTQRYQRITLAGRLRGAQMDVTYSESGTSSLGDKTGIAAGNTVREFAGALIKQA